MPRLRSVLLLALCLLLAASLVPGAAAAQPTDTEEPPDDARFQQVLLEDDLNSPMRLKVADDGRVIFVERAGNVRIWDPATQSTTLAGNVPVSITGEVGMIGLELAPDFADTGHVYLHYAPPNWSDHYITRVSRFTLRGDTLDVDSETQIYDVQHPEGVGGGHSAGDLEMTPDGILFISTGDNTGCCASFGYAPHDERPGRESHDAQRTSANTNDPNGKILRIRPLPEGGYEIPAGNLYPPGTEDTLPEIYAMGLRNPFVMGGYDPDTGVLLVGDHNVDALEPGPRGPAGYTKFHRITEPGFFGWPYCTGDNFPYTYWDYENDEPRRPFDCDNPTNESPNNTGLVELPPAQPGDIWYTYRAELGMERFPDLYGSGAHGGPIYHYDPDNPSETKFPEWFDGRWFLFDWVQDWVRTVRFDDDGEIVDLVRFAPELHFSKPMGGDFGPDGSLYVLAWGIGWGGDNDDAGLYRVDYIDGNLNPVARATSDVDSGPLPLEVAFDASASTDPDGDDDALTFAWDLDGDGQVDATGPAVTHTYTQAGAYEARVTVTDEEGATAVANLSIVAGNTRPAVEFETPADGTFAAMDDEIPYRIRVTDPEDGDIDCTDVIVSYSLGHDQHAHPIFETSPDADCEGVLVPDDDGAHTGNLYLYHVIEARYTDDGGPDGAPALTGTTDIVLHPPARDAARYQAGEGVWLYLGQTVMSQPGSWLMFPRLNLDGIGELRMEVSSRGSGARISVHAGSPDGPVVAATDITDTGVPEALERRYEWFTAEVDDPGGVNDLYWRIDRAEGAEGAFPEIFFRNFQFVPAPPPCPEPDTRPTVAIGGVDTGVPNRDRGDGCTINDLIDDEAEWRNHGSFVSHVEEVADGLLAAGVIDGRERGALMRSAARSDVAGPDRR